MENPSQAPATTAPRFRYYDLVMAAFVTILLLSNLIGASKPSYVTLPIIGEWSFGAGVLFFPVSYIIGDILTEVYGYARSRRVVWAGFGALAFAALMSAIVVHLPPAPGWTGQAVIEAAFGSTWRIALASLLGYWCGEFVNSFTLARMKVLTRGRWLWTRTIGSTLVGEAADTMIFYPLAFYGVWDNDLLLAVMGANYCIKVGWEVLATPVTYRIVSRLKRAEQEDYFDDKTDFNPFTLKV